MAHITGGGITDNLPRVLPKGHGAVVEMGTWPVLPNVYSYATYRQRAAGRDDAHFQHGYWHGAGGPGKKVQARAEHRGEGGEKAYLIGRIVKGDRKVQYA